jgi:phage-related protein
LPEAVYVLHAFQKKTQKTATNDLELVKTRAKDLLRKRN